MGVSYPVLMSDDMPAHVIDDYLLVMRAEAEKQRREEAEAKRKARR